MSTDTEDAEKIFAVRTTLVLQALGEDMSKRQLARDIGVSGPFLSQVSNGKAQPSFTLATGLRKVYGVSLDWYLMGLGPMFVPEEQRHLEPAVIPPQPAPPPHELHKLVEEVLELDDKEITAEVRGLIRGILHGRRKEMERQREQDQLKKSA